MNVVGISIMGLVSAFLLLALPIAGVVINGEPIAQYTEFPPLTRYVEHAGFSWLAFIGLAALIILVVAPFLKRVISAARPKPGLSSTPRHSFPFWGWLGVASGIIFWVLAWNRFDWFKPFQPFTFSPLWFSYIVTINALDYWRSGRCMMTHRTPLFISLFPVSATFWWFFEYLNRFVQNWYYIGVEGLTPMEYMLFATLPFSTVLPAVLGTFDFLATFPRLTAGLDNFVRMEIRRPRTAATLTLLIAGAGLAGIGIWPDYLFPLLWVSPLCIIVALQMLASRETILKPLASGDWREIFLLALAALICGFFWEMWNFKSQAQWIYAVPFVNRFHIFEMPLLGYAGYLPFGLECAVIGTAVKQIVDKVLRRSANDED